MRPAFLRGRGCPLVSVIHYDELEHCRHSLNNYDVCGMFTGDEELDAPSYGQLQYVPAIASAMDVFPFCIVSAMEVFLKKGQPVAPF